MTVRTIARVRCDGCGLEVEKEPNTVGPDGWRHLEIAWSDGRITTRRKRDVCPDPLCAARVVELTRDEADDAPGLPMQLDIARLRKWEAEAR